jgi:hypothetical protein
MQKFFKNFFLFCLYTINRLFCNEINKNKKKIQSFYFIIARIFDYFDSGVMEGLQHRLLELAKTRTQGQLSETPGNSMTLTSQVSLNWMHLCIS